MHPSEEAIIATFVTPNRRPRWLLSLDSAKRRRKFLDCLNHCTDLDLRFSQPLKSNSDVIGLLQSHGAPATCYVLSATESLDGREMPLDDAVSAFEIAGWGTIISCIPRKLAYYYDECGERRSLLLRTDA
ncbi:MAG: hypothetical protein HON53_01965 [Planctomycetaceae bacterium]|nr:hypothetical protein [Planctomycetaceae bacterium]MBT6156128.1 hypothetical protein [Planctomycetaceae bacterium]MBT6486366.1 hypothetical protein [Planctomycetaceae bacterium]MBT6493507.1 hypothetical protein [Planctomycetaceae bacterium]